ncbi:hypothetical protein SCHPADRAFT_483427 [Schizopora paradoxa]|uniref:Zn(2)-C6 fungal-type domain-containing protein n=1 Tax=Schizopora paradoxa TaxID=27342 RepID=A0A0H2RNV8_9AGAM|nr:hypothetical protein SCHPADRAFT_483427 [Schizopora paradoxa]
MPCIQCRSKNLSCSENTPCQWCSISGEVCQPISEAEQIRSVLSAFGPKAYFNEYPDKKGYFVIYTRQDGNMYVANLNKQFKKVGEDKHLGHESNVSNVPYNRQFTVEDLINAGRSFNG